MSSSDESSTNNIKERETQFIPRSDDDEVLWDVLEITAERGKKYKVKWVGIDPATGKPWAQSWVAKHDCTDKLVAEWKAKQKKVAAGKKRSRPSKHAGSSTLGNKTRPSVSEVASSRPGSAGHPLSPPPKKATTKRKRQPETPTTTSSDAVEADKQTRLPRLHKRQKMMLEALLPPISSDEDEDVLRVPETRARVIPQKKVFHKSNGASLDVSEEDNSSPPKTKGKFVRRSAEHSKRTPGSSRSSDLREESGLPHSKTKTKVVPQHKERVTDADVRTAVSRLEELRSSKLKKKAASKHQSPQQSGYFSEKEAELTIPRTKVGPPRGVKRRETLNKSGSSSKPGPSRTKLRGDDSADERVPGEESKGRPGKEVALLVMQDPVGSSTFPLPHISIRHVLPNARSRSPNLSPGAKARLELFDRMIADAPQPSAATSPADVLEPIPDDTHFNYDHTHDTHGTFDPPRPLSPPFSPKNSKPGTPSRLIVPETESSGNSQSQSQSMLKPPSPQLPPARDGSPRKPIDLPTIAVIAASATSSSASPQTPFLPPRGLSSNTNHLAKKQTIKPIVQMPPSAFRSTNDALSRITDSEAPPSSIESFTSPKRVDKGKQRAVDDDDYSQSNLSEEEGNGERREMTNSELKNRGKELFDQVQLTRDAERQKKLKAKQLKAFNDIVNGAVSSPSKDLPLPSIGGSREEVVDMSGFANSTTLDTQEHGEARPMNKEERERLRIELRQEEEESTQEAVDAYPLPPTKKPEVVDDGDVQMPSRRSPKNVLSDRQIEDTDHAEQPSTDLQQASVNVQASQEQRHEDTEIEPLLANQLTSSPARPENLTDSSSRRLGEALSLLNVKSEEIQRLERDLADERKNIWSLKAELTKIQQSLEPTGPVLAAWEAERAQWSQERSSWKTDLSLWQTQRKEMSEERASLSARVAELSDAADQAEEARAKLSELEAERVAWTEERDRMQNDIALRSEELTALAKVRGVSNQDRSRWEIERTSWVEEKARWETERAALQEKQEALLRSIDELTVKVESVTAVKVSAEKDREFFREQYTQASGFVGSVREENIEFENRMKIAEGQAQDGVAAIKSFFEGRVKALQADVDRWKSLTELLQEKDRRTNDELRLRAAQVPELRDLCGRLGSENKSLRADVQKLERVQQRSVIKRKKLYHEIFGLKKERVSLRSKLSQLVKMADSGSQEISHSLPTPPSMDPNDMETMSQSPGAGSNEPTLFPCLWRPQWRDQCQQVFDAKEDLERHLQVHFRDLLTE